jgi:hypothetical protein
MKNILDSIIPNILMAIGSLILELASIIYYTFIFYIYLVLVSIFSQ